MHQLEEQLTDKQAAIDDWFTAQFQATPAPIYASVDLRHSGFKFSPIDTNCFPAGFNNLHADSLSLAAKAFSEALPESCQRVLLATENHTRNQFYLENVAALAALIKAAGKEVRMTNFRDDLTESLHLELASGKELVFEPMQRRDDAIHVGDFVPDVILLNNDLSDGEPDILKNLTQPILPSPGMGWQQRKKSQHFACFQRVSEQFSEAFGLEPWFLSPLFRNCGMVDFMKREGEDCLIRNARALFHQIEEKYETHGIQEKPFIVVKADAGTYGMGIMMVHDPMELRDLNRKQRTHMAASKGHQKITQVILQEGVHSIDKHDGATAEPVVYMVNGDVVGGFYRLHPDKLADENLNAPGMVFHPLAPDLPRAYQVLARLAALAVAHEQQGINA
ncbi:MAG: glutamate--cysteine ligase [marine bacterium B5-7]|nr:MAG: glutamate--cysteine ligase [marine bacterium B5-7]